MSLVENFLEHPRQIDSGDTFFGAILKANKNYSELFFIFLVVFLCDFFGFFVCFIVVHIYFFVYICVWWAWLFSTIFPEPPSRLILLDSLLQERSPLDLL